MDTPGSKVDRHIEVDLTLDRKNMEVMAQLTSPWKQASLQGNMT